MREVSTIPNRTLNLPLCHINLFYKVKVSPCCGKVESSAPKYIKTKIDIKNALEMNSLKEYYLLEEGYRHDTTGRI